MGVCMRNNRRNQHSNAPTAPKQPRDDDPEGLGSFGKGILNARGARDYFTPVKTSHGPVVAEPRRHNWNLTVKTVYLDSGAQVPLLVGSNLTGVKLSAPDAISPLRYCTFSTGPKPPFRVIRRFTNRYSWSLSKNLIYRSESRKVHLSSAPIDIECLDA